MSNRPCFMSTSFLRISIFLFLISFVQKWGAAHAIMQRLSISSGSDGLCESFTIVSVVKSCDQPIVFIPSPNGSNAGQLLPTGSFTEPSPAINAILPTEIIFPSLVMYA